MSFIETLIIAIGLSMDAFAVATTLGLKMKKITIGKMLIVGLYFGIFQGGLPLLGYYIGILFADKINQFDHWIAFFLLVIIGMKMLIGSLIRKKCSDRPCPKNHYCLDRDCPNESNKEIKLTPAKMLPLAIATSIDALAVGVSFAFLAVKIFVSAITITITTLILSIIGVNVGNILGKRFKIYAELIGGIVLVLIGVKILLQHLSIINF